MSIEKFDIRVGVIRSIAKHPNADSLYVESIDLNEETGPRQVLSGLVKHLPEDALLNSRVLVCCNLKPAKMRGMDSFGMLLCGVQRTGSGPDDEIVRLVKPSVDCRIGERVSIEGFAFDASTAPAAIDGRKGDAELFKAVFGSGDLKTDAQGVACFKGIPLMTSTGPCKCELTDALVQ